MNLGDKRMNKVYEYINEERLNQDFIFDFIQLRHKLGLTQTQAAIKSNQK